MQIGKVANSLLEELISDIEKRPEVLIGSKIGRDTSILDLGDDLLVVSTDPITGASKNIGSLAINVAVNDLTTEGAEPVAALLTVLLPSKTSEEDLKKLMADAKEAARKINLTIIGGHTEITDAVKRPVVSTTVLGKISGPYEEKKIEVNDLLIVTKSLGLEGTAILAAEREDQVRKILTADEYKEALAYKDLTSVVKEGKILKSFGAKYMHDVTEGGLLGAAWEAAKANEAGLVVFDDSLPVTKATEKIANAFDIDYRKLISSGSMLAIISQKDFIKALEELADENIKATIIGRVTDYEGVFLRENGKMIPLGQPKADDLYKALK
ncbi:AIR synthase family protein [Neofamilia massiliensis]|uniref:AIR synthase family protein n=1 Tax=Neofamilia massiliensis TaxID=1673724 RepID=UPI0006BB997C|nr:AIR synthase family protein [Neofamilia massiliensis]